MWYDPATVPGGADLDPSAFATHVPGAGRVCRPLAPGSPLTQPPQRACLSPPPASHRARPEVPWWLLRTREGRPEPSGALVHAAARSLLLLGGPARHQVRAFVDVGDAECCCYQNPPERRSVPQVAHAHVFLRARSPETAAALAQLRAARRLRSPWAEAERIGGRGGEVGF